MPSRLVTSAVEHSSVLKVAEALKDEDVDILPVDSNGRVEVDKLINALKKPASLVSIQYANSETGTVQPVEEIGNICREHNVLFHVDASQVVGRISIDLGTLPIDYLTFTAHKIHGPQGVGAVAIKSNNSLGSVFYGGDQEQGIRPGTENIPSIAGFGVAAQIREQTMPNCINTMRKLRDIFERLVLSSVPGAMVNGDIEHRIPNSTNIYFPNVEGMAMMAQLDAEGICCSFTSACVSARPEPSYVLTAMGLSEEKAYSSIRFSFSILNTEEEAVLAANRIGNIYAKLAGGMHQASGMA